MAPIKWVAYDTDIECSKPEKFGMYHGQPCLMIKLNKARLQSNICPNSTKERILHFIEISI